MTDTKKRLEDAELAQALREKIAALSTQDLSMMVLAATQALGDTGYQYALAEECSMSTEEVASWEARVFYDGEVDPGDDDYVAPEQDDLVTIALHLQRLAILQPLQPR